MDTDQIEQYYKIFKQLWEEANEKENIKAFQNAENILIKILPELKVLISDENKEFLSGLFSDFCQFLLDFINLMQKLGVSTSRKFEDLYSMAETVVELSPNYFDGHYYKVIYLSSRLTKADAGQGSAIYEGQGAADTIVGTAFNLLGKGIRLGVTATAAGISKNRFIEEIRDLILAFQNSFQEEPYSSYSYLLNGSRLMDIAEYCEDEGYKPMAKEIYIAIKSIDISCLDYSDYKEEYRDESKKDAMRMHIIADSKS